MNRLSHSSVRMYSECGRKYYYHYVKKLRPRTLHGALLFGSALDNALNQLLKTKNHSEALAVFEKAWETQDINKVPTYLPHATNVAYSPKDFDFELLTKEDYQTYITFKIEQGLDASNTIEADYSYIMEKKGKQGFKSLEEIEKKSLNLINWMSLRRKGQIMLKSYESKVLPKIKDVLAIQKKSTIKNEEGDEIVLYLDFIVELHDGTRWILDNKTTSIEYEPDSPMKSQQLILYYHSEKDEFKLDGVGFVPIYKQILKNRVKTCSACQFDGTGARHKTCPSEVTGKRCNAPWIESIDPEARIEMLLNRVPEAAESLVIETFDESNQGIKKGAFAPNLGACGSPNTGWMCPFYNKCWKGQDDDLTQVD
jgi:hypothetical protein